MSLVTIRIDLDTGRCRRGFVPICISATDADGHRIAFRWIEAVIRIADYLRRLARERMRDIWRVSGTRRTFRPCANGENKVRISGTILTGRLLPERSAARTFGAWLLLKVSTSSVGMATSR